MSNLSDLGSKVYLGIAELPAQLISRPSQLNSLRSHHSSSTRSFAKIVLSPKTDLWVHYERVPGVVEKI
jgi:hypothetical protein